MQAVVEPFPQSGRLLGSWIDGYVHYTRNVQSPYLLRKWAGICAVAACMERKVWIRSQRENLYPNLFVFLVSPPGVGKTRAIGACEALYRELNTHHIAKVSLTKASLMDELALATRKIYTPNGDIEFNSLFVASKEFSTLVPGYDSDFLNALTYLYDNLLYDEKRRGSKDPLIIPNPQINLLGCTTPSYLVTTMPAGAWEQGFLARVIIIYSEEEGEPTPLDLYEEVDEDDTALEKALIHDMRKISERTGKLKFADRKTADVLDNWNKTGRKESQPRHPRLNNYSTRRMVHLLKLCMISCVDRGAPAIDLYDFHRALEWLLEAERVMPDVFTAMTSGGDSQVIGEAQEYIRVYAVRNDGKLCPLPILLKFLQGRVPIMAIDRIVESMVRAEKIVVVKTTGGEAVRALDN